VSPPFNLRLKTPAAALAVPWDSEVIDHLRVPDEDEDEATRFCYAAQERVQDYLGLSMLAETFVMQWRLLPTGSTPLELVGGPCKSITHLKYTDTDGDVQTLVEDTDFYLEQYRAPARLHPVYGTVWPTSRDFPDSVECEFVNGHANAAAVPHAFKQAIRLFLGHYNENREEVIVGTIASPLPEGAKALLRPHRRVRIGV
jgi:uncharacterized phiE125 gp8 family phage protein